jgi:hypothetical protein
MTSSVKPLPAGIRKQIQNARTKEQTRLLQQYGEKKVGTAVTDSIEAQDKAHGAKQSKASPPQHGDLDPLSLP